jgi:CRISPR/Cas system-associated exonuclease Cas4 (RecB family)
VALESRTLNPAQQELLNALRAAPDERPLFDPGLRAALVTDLEEQLAALVPMLDTLGIVQLWVTKHRLSSVSGCEVRFLAEEDAGFDGWTVPKARGSVAHRAIELSMHVRGEPVPEELVDEAISRMTEADTSLGDWLQTVSEADRADLRCEAVDRVSSFLELWPPLKPQWRPRCESKVGADLLDGRMHLAGKVDLSIGVAEGMRAGKVLIDLKTGGFSPTHLDDLRFYALVEAIKLGVPPRRVATHYLDTGKLVPEDVTEATLASAARRVADGVRRWLELRGPEATPVVKPGPACRWCPVLSTCEAGRAHTAMNT